MAGPNVIVNTYLCTKEASREGEKKYGEWVKFVDKGKGEV
jgi:hypothetical protein